MHKTAAFEDISVTIFKEGDRSLQVKIPVRVHLAHAQSGWTPFLNHVMRELKLEDIDGVYEDVNGAPVARIASLVDGGLYFARPTELCAMLRSLARAEPEHYPAWPSIEEGLEAKRELERCQDYYEHQLLPMSLETGESKVAPAEALPEEGDGAFVWAMRVKQGFKCRVYMTPECRLNEVLDVLPMGTIVTLSTDWGEAMEKHSLRGKGKGKVLWMVDPQEGFLERRPLEEVPEEEKASVAVVPAAPATFTTEERMEVIRAAASMLQILRTTLRRGAYFKGAGGVHDCVEVHRAALRAAATLMRKDPSSREALLECAGAELFVLIILKFCDDRLVCEFGCWAIAVFAGEGDPGPDNTRFQAAAAEAGVMEAVGAAVDRHRESAPLRRHCVGALAAIVDGNAATAEELRSRNLHVTVAEDSIRRWPNDAELSCLACWVLRSVVDPSWVPGVRKRKGLLSRREDGMEGDSGEGKASAAFRHSQNTITGGGDEGAVLSDEKEARKNTIDTESAERTGGSVNRRGSTTGDGEVVTVGGSVFGVGGDETSDVLISLDGASKVDINQAFNSALGTSGVDLATASDPAFATPLETANALVGDGGKEEPFLFDDDDADNAEPSGRQAERLTAGEGCADPAVFGEIGEAVLERLLKLAAATEVLNHNNEDTREAASILVEALLRCLESGYANSTRRKKNARRKAIARTLQEGRALGAL